MKTYLFRLTFPVGAHFGRQGIGLEETQETVASDSLWSAVINAFALMDEAGDVLRAAAEPEPPFVVSSLFPFGPDPDDSRKRLYALPRPMTSPAVHDAALLQRAGKDLKKIRYLEPRHVLA